MGGCRVTPEGAVRKQERRDKFVFFCRVLQCPGVLVTAGLRIIIFFRLLFFILPNPTIRSLHTLCGDTFCNLTQNEARHFSCCNMRGRRVGHLAQSRRCCAFTSDQQGTTLRHHFGRRCRVVRFHLQAVLRRSSKNGEEAAHSASAAVISSVRLFLSAGSSSCSNARATTRHKIGRVDRARCPWWHPLRRRGHATGAGARGSEETTCSSQKKSSGDHTMRRQSALSASGLHGPGQASPRSW